MNIHLHVQLNTVQKMLFVDCQEQQLKNIHALYQKYKDDQSIIDFWKKVKDYFENDCEQRHSFNAPCSFVEDSPSVGRHRQHFYIKDKSNTLYQIDALTHRDKLKHSSDQYCLGALGYAFTQGNEIAIDEWFYDFRKFTLQKLKNSLKAFEEDFNHSYSKYQLMKEFHSTLFHFLIYDFKSDLSRYEYKGFPDLHKLYELSNPYKKEHKTDEHLNVFINELKSVISKI